MRRSSGPWHIYFAAGDGDDKFHIRTYVLACPNKNPLTGEWSELGQLETPWDSFNLDATSFVHQGMRYLCWAQHEPGIDTDSNLYLATPTTFAKPPARLTVPTYPWETIGFKVNEGAAILVRNGRLFLTYSAATTDANYCMGMLTARDEKIDGDPLFDPNRHTRVQYIRYTADGVPDFGAPVANGPLV